ncbi:SusC/RagA family TonB-linked outer membrane protein [Niabella aurantiaca]|uniref:SusC/RagA family TonB-linked outer membrane protein n=1 Tax=Niabella aurantiaca TaxID=379900 RepID=UPI00035D95D5|nr:TonB-dependent receptor [Niabella aurantiaca]
MNRKSFILIVLLLSLFCVKKSMAQAVISGKVTSAAGQQPLAGATVILKGTAIGTHTDAAGAYSIQVPQGGGTLVFSFTGFEMQEVVPGSRTVINVSLTATESQLNEVVVIGYGETRRKDLTGSVGSVKMADLQKAPVRSFEEALAGRVAGVTASSDDGQPGASVNIVIRGNNSLTQDNSPLYVVDGFPMENPDNNAINPAEIESIEVLKDASSTAIYGARAANGVILITTKKGKIGKPVVNFNAYYGFQQYTKTMELMSPYEYIKYVSERNPAYADSTYLTEGKTIEDYRNIKGIDLQDSLLGARPFRNYFLSLMGGSNATKYSVSVSAFNQDGIIVNSGYDRYQGRLRLDQKVNKHLNTGINVNYSYLNQFGTSPSLGGNGFFSGNLLYSVWAFRPVRRNHMDEAEENLEDEEFLAVLSGFDPLKTAKNEWRKRISEVLTANAYADYSFARYFKLRLTGGLTKTKGRRETFNNTQTPLGSPLTKSGKDNGVSGSVIYNSLTSWVSENTLTFDRMLSAASKLNVLAGFTMQGTRISSYGAAANHIPNESLGISGIDEGIPVSITSTSSEYTLASFLGRVNYAYRSKYLLTGSLRADGSSKFAVQNRWSYFPSGAAAWRLSEEPFMKGAGFISDAKIRVSYGTTGNNRVSDFAYLSRVILPPTGGYSYNNTPENAAVLSELGNVNLKWETTAQSDIGLDLELFKGRIALAADVYRKITSNLLLDAAVPGSIGFTTALKNIGKVRNQGLELTLGTKNIVRKDFSWSSDFNISFNRNRVLALSDGETDRKTTAAWNTLTSSVPLYIAEVGKPIALFYGYIWEGNYQLSDFDQDNAGAYKLKAGLPSYGAANAIQPGNIRYKDTNGDGVINADDATVIGDPNPDFTGGFSNNLSYKNFDLNIFFNFSVGGDVFNANRIIFEGGGYNNGQNMYASYADRWTIDNPGNKYFRAGGGGPDNLTYSSRLVEDGSYLKLKTVQLGYNFSPQLIRKMNLSACRLYVSAQNLYTWTKYEGFDPEVSKFGSSALRPAFDYSVYPYARTITFGLNVSF